MLRRWNMQSLNILFACLSRFRCWSMTTPRLVIHSPAGISHCSICMAKGRFSLESCWWVPMTHRSVLLALNLSMFNRSHSLMLQMAAWMVPRAIWLFTKSKARYSWVSSAYKWKSSPLRLMISPNGEIYARNRRGPRTLPCGTPHLTCTGSDREPFTETRWRLLER